MSSHQVLHLTDFEIGDHEIESGAVRLVKKLRPTWTHEDIKVTVFTGGLMNKMVGCCLNDDKAKEDMVLVRIHGADNMQYFLIKREEELRTVKMLHHAGYAQPLYAIFKNGIAYGYIEGECLNEKNVWEDHISSLVIKEMVKLHSVDPARASPPFPSGGEYTVKPESRDQLPIVKMFRRWVDNLPKCIPEETDISGSPKTIPCQKEMHKEIQLLLSELMKLDSPIVLCHNDPTPLNIVYNKQHDRTYFIDFEICCFNYEAYDIAAHFCCYTGEEILDFSHSDKAYQAQWIRRYLQCQAEHKGQPAANVTDEDVQDLYVAMEKCTMVTHFFEAMWALFMVDTSTIPFDYIGYATKRLAEYFKKKEEIQQF